MYVKLISHNKQVFKKIKTFYRENKNQRTVVLMIRKKTTYHCYRKL